MTGRAQAGVRPEIAESWRRSARWGVAGDEPLAPPEAEGAEVRGRLAGVAAPVLERLSENLADTRTTVVLTDAHAGILARRAGTSALHDLLDGVGLVPGYSYAEDAVGTNGMGTAAEERRPVKVAGEEHFAEALRGLTCVGVPIQHPVTGRLEGVVDLTCFNEDAGPWMTPLVIEAVNGVQDQLYAAATVGERALLAEFLRASHGASVPIVTLNASMVLTNPAAARLLVPSDHGLLWEVLSGERNGEVVRDVELASGETVRARSTPIEVGARSVGAVVALEPVSPLAAPRRRSGPRPDRTNDVAAQEKAVSGGAAWQRVRRELRAAVAAGEATLLVGPTGSGKATLAAAVAKVPADRVLDAGRLALDGPKQWLASVAEALAAGGAVVLRRLDALDRTTALGLAALLDEAPARTVVVATTVGGATPDDAHQGLLDRFAHVVSVPGLADRVDDLPDLVRGILRRLVPAGPPVAAPEVVQALQRLPWPGNLRQLHQVLHRAVARRPVGRITLDDIPADVRAATHRRHLLPLEQRECEAITAALADADGNKAAAAAALGISRSTLYRKLESYGLDLDRRTY